MNITLGELVGYVVTTICVLIYLRGMYLAYVEYKENGFNDITFIVGIINFILIVAFFGPTLIEYFTEHWDNVIF